jgi:ABC-type amino acid transport substrate-binding protein
MIFHCFKFGPTDDSLGLGGQSQSQNNYIGTSKCVNEAIAALEADGTIAALMTKWLGTDYTVPELN